MASQRISAILHDVGSILNDLPGVFSTPQWGGRAFKLPGPGGNRKKPKLVAHVYLTNDEKAVGIAFKLPKERAAALVEQHDWIEPHSFRTLAPSGWIVAHVTQKRQINMLSKLLIESREQYPKTEEPTDEAQSRETATGSSSGPVARHIDRVMREAKLEGWSPHQADAFD